MSGRKWTDEEIEYLEYVAGKQSYETIAKILKRSTESVKHKAYRLNLQEKITYDRREWSQEDINFLKKNYRKKSVKYISKKLNRSIASVKHKAERYGLCDTYVDALSINLIAKAFDCDLCVIKRWINKFDLLVKKRRIGKCTYYQIYGEDFWDWAVEHKEIVPIQKYKSMSILPEPDCINNIEEWGSKYRYKIPLTTKDINYITWLRGNGMSIREIANRVNRTESSVKHILGDYYK